jgi:hypothetical protein
MTSRRNLFAVMAGVAAVALTAPAMAATIEMQSGGGASSPSPGGATATPGARSAPNPTAMEPARTVRRSRRRRRARRAQRRSN